MTDTAFMGRVGEVELGASAIAGTFYMVIFMVAFGFSIGTQILIARRNGEGHYRAIGSLFYQGLYFQIALAAVIFLVSILFSPWILRHIVSSPQIADAAVSYLNWRVFGAFFSFTAAIFRAFFIGTTQTKTLTLNSVVMVASNILFNYVLIFGHLGFPALGIAGAAIGSSLAEGVSLVFFIVYTRRRIDMRKYNLLQVAPFHWPELRRMFDVAGWTMIQNFFSLSTWFLFFLFIEHLGERALAVSNIVRGVSGLLFTTMMAFASTCGSLVSNLLGAGHSDAVRVTIRRHILMAYLFVLPIALLIALFPHAVLSIYTDMEELRQAGVHTLWMMCSTYLVLVPGNVYFQSVSGTGNTRTAFALEMLTLVIYMVYISFLILYLRPDVMWCWTSEFVYGTFVFLFCYRYMKREKWKLKVI
jgi:putative MATE family efflux protein